VPADQEVISSAAIAVPKVGVVPADQEVISSAAIAVPKVGAVPADQVKVESPAITVAVPVALAVLVSGGVVNT